MKDLCILIMAAGKGTRMKSDEAKVLHTLCGVSMLEMVYRAASALEPEEIFVVVGQDADRVRASLEGRRAAFILQEEQLGTGHAVISARSRLEKLEGDLLVLFGDTPLVRPETLAKLAERHRASGADTTLLTARTAEPFGYGRILRAADGTIDAIIEEKDASGEQKAITEVNPGFYCFRIPALLEALGKLSNHNAQHEYYITDVIGIERRAGRCVEAFLHEDFPELLGVNSRKDLADAAAFLRARKNEELMLSGVTIIDPVRTYVDIDVRVERDVTIHPGVTLEGATVIGQRSEIRSGSRISHSVIGENVLVDDCTVITDSRVGDGSTVGPFARLRNGASIGPKCRVGNFVEIKKSSLAEGTKAAHHAYLGDAVIGSRVNIGAGTITCNYDGVRKYATVIEDDVFVGTDSQLVAPVRIGRGAYVAAGSCITEDVPAGSLAIARSRQTVKEGWAQRRKESPAKE